MKGKGAKDTAKTIAGALIMFLVFVGITWLYSGFRVPWPWNWGHQQPTQSTPSPHAMEVTPSVPVVLVAHHSPRLERTRRCIAWRESHNNPRARRRDGGTASGLYGFIDRTWHHYRGYRHAWQAPAWVQTQRFYAAWHYWLHRYHGKRSMNPWNYPHHQCF